MTSWTRSDINTNKAIAVMTVNPNTIKNKIIMANLKPAKDKATSPPINKNKIVKNKILGPSLAFLKLLITLFKVNIFSPFIDQIVARFFKKSR